MESFCVLFFRLNLLYNDVDAICERYYEHNTASNETKTTKITAAPSNNNANVKRLQLKN